MNFLGDLWNLAKKGLKKIAEEAIKFIIVKVGEFIKKIIELLLGKKYDPNNSTVEETKEINKLLEKCISEYTKEAEEYDREAKEVADKYFQKIIASLREINKIDNKEVVIEEYIFQILENRKEDIDKKFENIYSKEISGVFSLNNNILLDILKMEKSREKRNRLNDLVKNTIKNANKKLTDALKNSINKEQDFIMERLLSYIENRQNTLKTSKKETENIIDSLGKDKEERQKLEAKYDNIIEKLDLLENLMEA